MSNKKIQTLISSDGKTMEFSQDLVNALIDLSSGSEVSAVLCLQEHKTREINMDKRKQQFAALAKEFVDKYTSLNCLKNSLALLRNRIGNTAFDIREPRLFLAAYKDDFSALAEELKDYLSEEK